MKLGVFTVSAPEYYPLELMDKLSGIGYNGLEWRVTNDKGDRSKPSFWAGNRAGMTADELLEAADSLVQKAKKLNFEMPSIASYINCFDLEDVEKHFKAAKAIGAKNVRICPAMYDPEKSFNLQVAKTRYYYAMVAQLAAEYGLRACIETHMNYITPSMSKTMAILEGLDPKYVGIMWDPANQICEGLERIEMAMDIAGDYLAEIHAKNLIMNKTEVDGGIKWQVKSVALDQGQVDWKTLLEFLEKKQYDGWIFFEDFSTDKSTDEKLVYNYEYFKSLCSGNSGVSS